MSNTRKRKKFGHSANVFRHKLTFAALIVTALAAAALFVLDRTGVFTYSDWRIKLGLEEKPAVVENSDTQVHFIDVGQGDCSLVISDGKTMLIDCGDRDEDNTVIKYLQKLGIKKLDVIIATHPHSDHIGEMSEIIDSFETDKFIMPEIPKAMTPTSKTFENMLSSIKNRKMKITKAQDESFTLGSAEVQLFTSKEEHSDLNNYSVLVKIVHGDNSFLVTGDCETEEEKEMLEQGFDLSAKVLKVGHHGSSTSSSSGFLTAVSPKYAVISCGLDNKYGHPSDETLVRLEKYAENIYITRDDKTIVFLSDGKGLSLTK
ncbi:ComEC/Rec2 family competence protein [Hominimerdicola sp. 21CYCFAH17_S]